MSSDSDECQAIALLYCLKKKEKRPKRVWVSAINSRRAEYGEYRLCRELESHEDKFYAYFKMDLACFEELHNCIRDKISRQDTNWRRAISSRERLAICMRFLTTGDSYQSIAFSFRVGISTVSNIVKNVCMEIWNVLQPIYLPAPSEETWRQAEASYRGVWNFPNCIGSIDGKHIAIKCPPNSGSNYFNYKSFFSIVLLAIVDPNYKFIFVDIGNYGRMSDSTIFENSTFYKEYLSNGKTLLPPAPLPGEQEPTAMVLIGDEGFALSENLMRPFPRSTAINDRRKRNFNYRLSRSRRSVENTFGIMVQKYRLLLRPIETDVETTVHIVKSICCLHNFLRVKGATSFTTESNTTQTTSGSGALQTLAPTNHNVHNRRPNTAYKIREKFVNYFYNNPIN